MKNSRIRVGLVGVLHGNMPGDRNSMYAALVKEVEGLQEELGFDLDVFERTLLSEEDGVCASNYYRARQADFVLILHASLGGGRTFLPLARMGIPIGVWSIPEPATSGVMQLNSICGLNLYSAIVSNYFTGDEIPMKWFYGYPQDPMFLERFRVTVQALRAKKTLANARIGLIGDIANGFENLNFDERVLAKKLGTSVYRRHTVEDIVRLAETFDDKEIRAEKETMLSEGQLKQEAVDSTALDRNVRSYLAFKRFARENAYDGLAISCWPKFQSVYGIAVCSSVSRLNNEGIPCSCEGDVPGLVNLMTLNALSGDVGAVMDLAGIDQSDSSVCMWHCGPAPRRFANRDGVRWDAHFNIGEQVGDAWHGKGVVTDLTFAPGEITISRVNNRFDSLLVMGGEVMDRKACFYGSGGWVNKLQIDGQSLSIGDCLNTVVVNGIDHHYELVYGNHQDALREFAYWTNIDVVKAIPYKTYMERK